MGKDAKPAKLPSAVPAAAQKTVPAEPKAKRKVVRQPSAPANTVLTDPTSIVDGIKAEYGWDDPANEGDDDTPLEPTQPEVTTTVPATPAKPAPAAVAAPAHSAVTLHLAKQLGLTDAEVADSSPKELDRLVQRLYDQRESLRREHVITEAKEAKRNPSPGAAPAASETSAPEPKELALPWGVDEEGVPIKESDLHPGLVNAFKAQAKEIADLKKVVGQLQHREMGRQHQTQAQKMESLFATNTEMFGEETGDKLQKSDPLKFQRRLALLTVMKALQSGNMEERFAEAHEIMYGKAPTTSAPTAETTPAKAPSATPPKDPATGQFVKAKADSIHDPDDWANAGSALPTNRMESVTKGKKSAADNVARLLKENPGLLPDDDYASEFLSVNGQV